MRKAVVRAPWRGAAGPERLGSCSAFATAPRPPSGLDRCALCHEDRVVPVWWDAVDDERWQMLLRCGECGTFREVVVANDVAKAFELDLARGTEQIRVAAERLDRDRMALETSALINALRRDLIDAGDFARRWPSGASRRAALARPHLPRPPPPRRRRRRGTSARP